MLVGCSEWVEQSPDTSGERGGEGGQQNQRSSCGMRHILFLWVWQEDLHRGEGASREGEAVQEGGLAEGSEVSDSGEAHMKAYAQVMKFWLEGRKDPVVLTLIRHPSTAHPLL